MEECLEHSSVSCPLLYFELLVFVPWIKPREMLSEHMEQSAWGGLSLQSLLPVAFSIYKSNHVILLLEAPITSPNCLSCVTRLCVIWPLPASQDSFPTTYSLINISLFAISQTYQDVFLLVSLHLFPSEGPLLHLCTVFYF